MLWPLARDGKPVVLVPRTPNDLPSCRRRCHVLWKGSGHTPGDERALECEIRLMRWGSLN
jgi:hypothetical protein